MSDPLEASNEGCNCLFWQYADALSNLAHAYNEMDAQDPAAPLMIEAMRATVSRMNPPNVIPLKRKQ